MYDDITCPAAVREILHKVGVRPFQDVMLEHSTRIKALLAPLILKVELGDKLSTEEHQLLLDLCRQLEDLTKRAEKYALK